MDIAKAMRQGFPDLEWHCRSDCYETLIVVNGEKPSLEELEKAYNDYLNTKEDNKRFSIQEQIDIILDVINGDDKELKKLLKYRNKVKKK